MTASKKKIWDITPLVTREFPIWPGSQPLARIFASNIERGDSLTSSDILATAHLGAHADAPSHYDLEGESIERCSLDYYLGRCQVVKVYLNEDKIIRQDHFKGPLLAPRVLFATASFDFERPFQKGFASIDPTFFEYLGKNSVKTIGIDTPSVDPYSEKNFPCHHLAFRFKIALLENLDLQAVPEGIYELIALPLKIQGFDASPVRAILRTISE